MKPYFRSLNKKVMVFLIVVLGASMAITASFYLRMQRLDALNSAKERVRAYSEIIQTNMLRMMEGGECNDIPLMVRALVSPKGSRTVRLFDSEGTLIESNKKEEIGKRFLIPQLFKSGNEEILQTTLPTGEKILQSVFVFYNEGKCIRCHPGEKRVMAYLEVDISITSIENRMKSFTQMQILSGFGILLILGGAIFFFFTRFINKPILDVSRKMVEVEHGNFDVQIPVNTQDEVGHLASSFNVMVEKLKEVRRRDEGHQKLLQSANADLLKRVEELNILYESSKAISQSLQVEEILRMTLENVTRSLGFDRAVLIVVDEKSGDLIGRWGLGIDEGIVQQVHIPKEEIKGILHETLQKKEPIIVRDTSDYPIIEKKEALRCWEVLNCQKQDCPVFQKRELRCWMVLKTGCHPVTRTFEEKTNACRNCLFLKEIVKRSDIVNLLLFGSRSFVSVPLTARDQVLGILLTDKLHSGKEIMDGDVRFLTTFISHVSAAIENAVLYQKLEKKVDLGQKLLQETNEQLRQKLEELNQITLFNESILHNLYGGIVSYNREGLITFMNKRGTDLLGWNESEVLGRSIDEVFTNDEKHPSFFKKSLEGNGDIFGETRILKKGGEAIPVEVFLSHLRDQDGDVLGFTGIFRDISEKKEIETRMHRMDKLASLGQLASGLAHEIKNPLAGIGSAVQVLSSSLQFSESQKEMAKEALKQIRRLDATIRNLLSFAKPGQPQITPTDLNEIIDAVLFLVSTQVKKQNIQIHLDLKRDLPPVKIDPQQIQQSILNVVLNAVEAMSSGGMLTISTKEKWGTESPRKATRYVSLVVSDTGIGIPEERIAQIFNPFYTTKPSGTGLGLSITQRIIEQHNGTIGIKSEPGKGTSFTIDLPV